MEKTLDKMEEEAEFRFFMDMEDEDMDDLYFTKLEEYLNAKKKRYTCTDTTVVCFIIHI